MNRPMQVECRCIARVALIEIEVVHTLVAEWSSSCTIAPDQISQPKTYCEKVRDAPPTRFLEQALRGCMLQLGELSCLQVAENNGVAAVVVNAQMKQSNNHLPTRDAVARTAQVDSHTHIVYIFSVLLIPTATGSAAESQPNTVINITKRLRMVVKLPPAPLSIIADYVHTNIKRAEATSALDLANMSSKPLPAFLPSYCPFSSSILAAICARAPGVTTFLNLLEEPARRTLLALVADRRVDTSSDCITRSILFTGGAVVKDDCLAAAIAFALEVDATIVPAALLDMDGHCRVPYAFSLPDALRVCARLIAGSRERSVALLIQLAGDGLGGAQATELRSLLEAYREGRLSPLLMLCCCELDESGQPPRTLASLFNTRISMTSPAYPHRTTVAEIEAARLRVEKAPLLAVAASSPSSCSLLGLLQLLERAAKSSSRLGDGDGDAVVNRPNSTTETTSETLSSNTLRGVFGQRDVCQALVEIAVWPRKHATLFQRLGLSTYADDGLLLFGPPGTGKTMLARALARQESLSLIEVRLTDVVCGAVGEGERRLAGLFAEAKRRAPSLLFIDELQAAFIARGDEKENANHGDVGHSLSASLAAAMDDLCSWNRLAGPEARVCVLAATNEPWAVDSALLRPGRLARVHFVGTLEVEGRRTFVEHMLAELLGSVSALSTLMSSAADDDTAHQQLQRKQLETTLVMRTIGYTGADMALLARRLKRVVVNLSRHRTLAPGMSLVQSLSQSVDEDTADSRGLIISQPTVSQEELRIHIQWQHRRQGQTLP